MRLRRFIPMLVGLIVALGTGVAGPPAAVAAAAQQAGPAFVHRGTTPLPDGFEAIEVDAGTHRVFVSSPASNVVTVLDLDGNVVGSIRVPGAGALLVDGPTLYVASRTTGRIDSFNTTTLAASGSYGAGVINNPTTLAKAGGRVWTTTNPCGGSVQLVAFVPGTSAIAVYPAVQSLWYCPRLVSNPVIPNQLIGFDAGLSPSTAVRLDVSTGPPVQTASLWDIGSNTSDVEVMPDGQTFAVASGAPYEISTFRVTPLERNGIVYPNGPNTNAVEATAARGGLVAAGRFAWYENDIDVFRLGDPSETVFRYDFGTTDNTLSPGGLAFGPGGSTLLAVSGDSYYGTTMLNVFGPPSEGGRYAPLTPARILDTRNDTGGLAGRIGSAITVDVQVTGRGGVPEAGVTAVAMNVTVTGPTSSGFLTIYPAGRPRPLASNLNFTPGQTVPNLVVVKVGAGGKVSMFNSSGATDVIYDVAGYFSESGAAASSDDGRYTALVPARILDTRTGTGGGVRLGPGASVEVQVSGRGGVPAAGAAAAVLNVAATGTTATSYLTIHPTGEPRPLAANLNFTAGDTVSNRAMVKLGGGGKVTIYNNAGGADVVVDVGGWFSSASVAPASGTYTPLTPARILDSRDDTGGVHGPLAAGETVAVQVTGEGGVPITGVSAVILNTTMVDAAGPGYLTMYPAGAARPLASDLNYAAGETRPNLTVVRVGDGGRIELFTSASGHVVIDVAGWIS